MVVRPSPERVLLSRGRRALSTDRTEKKLYDPSFRSCTRFIQHGLAGQMGYDAADLHDLVHWAEIIDGALYTNAKEAVDLGAPAMQLTLVIEGSKGSDMVQQIIRWMRTMPLAEIMQQPEIKALYAPLYERHLRSIEIIRDTSTHDSGASSF